MEAVSLTAWLSFTENCEFMLLFSYLFPCCQAFYFLLITSEIEPTSVYQKTITFFQFACLCKFHTILQVMVYFTQKVKLYLFAGEKIYSAI